MFFRVFTLFQAGAKRFAGLAVLWLLLVAPSLDAATSMARSEHTEAELIAEVATVSPGQPFWTAVRMTMDPHWHTYWINHGDVGAGTEIKWQLPPGWTAGEIQWPAPHRIVTGHFVSYGYENTEFLLVKLTPPAGAQPGTIVTLTANATWLECEELCINGGTTLSLELPVAAGPPKYNDASKVLIDAALAALPQPPTMFDVTAWRQGDKIYLGLQPKNTADVPAQLADVYFYSTDSQTKPSAEQTLLHGPNGWVLALTHSDYGPDNPQSLPGILTVKGSWSTSGNVPALAINPALATAPPAIFADVMQSLVPSVGIAQLLGILGLGFLGGLILNIMPCVFPVLALKVFGIVRQSGEERRKVVLHGLMFTGGVLVSMWALVWLLQTLRATGQELGWGFQLQEPGFVLGLAIFFLLFGLSLSGVFEIGTSLIGTGSNLTRKDNAAGSFFQGALAVVVATPCTAPFLGAALGAAFTLPTAQAYLAFTAIALGLASPYLLLSLFPVLARFLPKPGAWMETFKQFMAFPLYGTVGYMLYILAGQVPDERFRNILFALVLVALAAWFYGRFATPSASTARRRFGVIGGLILFVAGTALAFWPVQQLNWEPWSPARVAELQKDGRPIYVDFTARWCATCQVNKEVVFHSERVLQALKRDNVALLRADWTMRDPAITAELARFGRAAVPFNLIYLPGHTDPIVLPPTLSPGIVLDALAGQTPPGS